MVLLLVVVRLLLASCGRGKLRGHAASVGVVGLYLYYHCVLFIVSRPIGNPSLLWCLWWMECGLVPFKLYVCSIGPGV